MCVLFYCLLSTIVSVGGVDQEAKVNTDSNGRGYVPTEHPSHPSNPCAPGGKRTVVVPPALAYGEEGAVLTPNPKKPDDVVRIPPGATLVYTVELTRVSIAPS